MTHGPGKFDAECTAIREAEGASGVAVLVLGGKRGGGFSLQGTLEAHLALPQILEDMAAGIRRDLVELVEHHAKVKGMQ